MVHAMVHVWWLVLRRWLVCGVWYGTCYGACMVVGAQAAETLRAMMEVQLQERQDLTKILKHRFARHAILKHGCLFLFSPFL